MAQLKATSSQAVERSAKSEQESRNLVERLQAEVTKHDTEYQSLRVDLNTATSQLEAVKAERATLQAEIVQLREQILSAQASARVEPSTQPPPLTVQAPPVSGVTPVTVDAVMAEPPAPEQLPGAKPKAPGRLAGLLQQFQTQVSRKVKVEPKSPTVEVGGFGEASAVRPDTPGAPTVVDVEQLRTVGCGTHPPQTALTLSNGQGVNVSVPLRPYSKRNPGPLTVNQVWSRPRRVSAYPDADSAWWHLGWHVAGDTAIFAPLNPLGVTPKDGVPGTPFTALANPGSDYEFAFPFKLGSVPDEPGIPGPHADYWSVQEWKDDDGDHAEDIYCGPLGVWGFSEDQNLYEIPPHSIMQWLPEEAAQCISTRTRREDVDLLLEVRKQWVLQQGVELPSWITAFEIIMDLDSMGLDRRFLREANWLQLAVAVGVLIRCEPCWDDHRRACILWKQEDLTESMTRSELYQMIMDQSSESANYGTWKSLAEVLAIQLRNPDGEIVYGHSDGERIVEMGDIMDNLWVTPGVPFPDDPDVTSDWPPFDSPGDGGDDTKGPDNPPGPSGSGSGSPGPSGSGGAGPSRGAGDQPTPKPPPSGGPTGGAGTLANTQEGVQAAVTSSGGGFLKLPSFQVYPKRSHQKDW